MKTVLLASAGGLTGTYLYRHLSKYDDIRIVAVDTNKIVPASVFANTFYVVPSVKDENYFDVIQEIIKKENVNILIPVASHDMDFYVCHKNELNSLNVSSLILDCDKQKLLSNKRSCYRFLSSIGIKTPAIYTSQDDFDFPIVIKPERSSGSKNTHIIRTKTEYDFWCQEMHEYCLVEYLDGDEFTVDCLFDSNGECLGYNPRLRIKTVGGGVVVTKNIYTEDVAEIISILSKLGWIVGPINFQYKRNKNGEPVIFDFNTRLASGGLPLTVKSGFDIPRMIIDLLDGKQVSKWERRPEIHGLTMIRYYEEVFLHDKKGIS